MEAAEIADLYPRLFHMAEVEALPSILENGLLSTASIVDELGLDQKTRDQLLRSTRPSSLTYNHPKFGQVTIRDNKPMNFKKLESVVRGISAGDFLELINSRVFFWPTRDRLERLLAVYSARPQLILEFDTSTLLAAHADDVDLSLINSGTVRMPTHLRGAFTFAPMLEIDFDHWRAGRPRRTAIAEVCILDAVVDVEAHMTTVTRVEPDGSREIVYKR